MSTVDLELDPPVDQEVVTVSETWLEFLRVSNRIECADSKSVVKIERSDMSKFFPIQWPKRSQFVNTRVDFLLGQLLQTKNIASQDVLQTHLSFPPLSFPPLQPDSLLNVCEGAAPSGNAYSDTTVAPNLLARYTAPVSLQSISAQPRLRS